jgi:DNA-binding transcriptional MerR regulator
VFEQLGGEPIYNTQAVVQRTGVPADTFRAWERRYGVPQPSRTPTNQRLYSERDIATINWLREHTATGMTISQAIALLTKLTEEGRSGQASLTSRPGGMVGGAARSNGHAAGTAFGRDTSLRLVEALAALDGAAATRILEEALLHASVETVAVEVLQRALHEIGRRWEHGSINVGMEHYASAFIHRQLGELFNASHPDEGRGPIVAACVSGEQHELGLLLASLFLSRHGYHVVYLGGNMPLLDLEQTIHRVKPRVVMLSASRRETAEVLRDWAPPLRAVLSEHGGSTCPPPIVFGGAAFTADPALRATVEGVYLGDDARDIVHQMDRVFAGELG